MKFSVVLILIGMTAFAYGSRSVPQQHLQKFLNSLHLSERAQKEWKDWNDGAKRDGNNSPSWNPLYVPRPASETNSEKGYGQNLQNRRAKPTGGPYPSGKPVTGGAGGHTSFSPRPSRGPYPSGKPVTGGAGGHTSFSPRPSRGPYPSGKPVTGGAGQYTSFSPRPSRGPYPSGKPVTGEAGQYTSFSPRPSRGPYPSGKPVTDGAGQYTSFSPRPSGGPFPSGKPVTKSPKEDEKEKDDREIPQLLQRLRRILEQRYNQNGINSNNNAGTNPTSSPKPSNDKPITGPTPLTEKPVTKFPEDKKDEKDDREIAQLLQYLRRKLDHNTITSSDTAGTKPTFRRNPTKPTTKKPWSDDDGQKDDKDDKDKDDKFTKRPLTASAPSTDEHVKSMAQENERRVAAKILGKLDHLLKRYNSNDNSFTTDSNPTGSPPTTRAPGSKSDDGDKDGDKDGDDNSDDHGDDDGDDDDVSNLAECVMYDVVGNFFQGFPNGSIRNNLIIKEDKIHYILTRAVRQFQLFDGKMDEVLKTLIKGLVEFVILPHKTCPATKFHQVVIWAMNYHMRFHLTNDSGSLKEHFKAILTNTSFDPNDADQVAGYMVSELQAQLKSWTIHFLKNELLNDFLIPLGYIVREMKPILGAPRNNTQIDELLHDVKTNNPWLTMCLPPSRLMEIHRHFVDRLNKLINDGEINDFLDRAKDTLAEEFLVATGSEQRPLVKRLVQVLESHMQGFLNSSKAYAEALLSNNTSQLTSFLAPIMKPSQQAYLQRILTSLTTGDTGTSTTAPTMRSASTNKENKRSQTSSKKNQLRIKMVLREG